MLPRRRRPPEVDGQLLEGVCFAPSDRRRCRRSRTPHGRSITMMDDKRSPSLIVSTEPSPSLGMRGHAQCSAKLAALTAQGSCTDAGGASGPDGGPGCESSTSACVNRLMCPPRPSTWRTTTVKRLPSSHCPRTRRAHREPPGHPEERRELPWSYSSWHRSAHCRRASRSAEIGAARSGA